MSIFLTNFACRYFSVISANMRQYAPTSCTWAAALLRGLWKRSRAAAQDRDAISFNIYSRSLDTNVRPLPGR